MAERVFDPGGLNETCGCGEVDCDYLAYGYPHCPRCQEHHRPWPQCPGIRVLDDGTVADARLTDETDPPV